MKTHTRGNVIVEDIKIGDIHYEYEYNFGIKVEVISLPIRSEEGEWSWQSKQVSTGRIIDYLVVEGYTHYSAKLYDYEAYEVKHLL
jgi:hypothetical protein